MILKKIGIYLPCRLVKLLENKDGNEVRIALDSPLQLMQENELLYINKYGETTKWLTDCPVICREEIKYIYERVKSSTRFDQSENAANGFILLDNGVRVGIAGHRVKGKDHTFRISEVTGLVFRFFKTYKDCSQCIYETIRNNCILMSALIVSKPCMGKTTMLRDLTRKLSADRIKCCVIDTTLELSLTGINLGESTLIMKGYEKLDGAVCAIKNLSPDILIFDEITSLEDIASVEYTSSMGVPIIATYHAADLIQLLRRDDMKKIIKKGIFDYVFFLGDKPGEIQKIISCGELCSNI